MGRVAARSGGPAVTMSSKNKVAKPFFVGGTSSNAGKSWMVTAICAWLRSKGVRVAPFKAQNMSNNSFPCRAGGEIGRAQVAQAEACGLEPEPAMNPILLKPSGDGISQVIVNGRMWKTMGAREYYGHADELKSIVRAAYQDLSQRFDVVVIEGAGSVSELNLREHDLVNLRLAACLKSPWILVADIERGGVFGSIVGTVSLLTPEERSLLRGFVVNKFRGDPSLFEDGVAELERRTGVPCLGVFPFASAISLDAEDSLAIETRPRTVAPPNARTAVIHFPHISNSTDLRLLTWADWITHPPSADYDVIVLPGSKSTISDLQWLHLAGLASWLIERHRRGAMIIGVCGGYQMLGRTIADPDGVESPIRSAKGLGLIPADTVLASHKTTRVVTATTSRGTPFGAYEIHLGETTIDRDEQWLPFARLADGSMEGVRGPGVIGTYLHGALEHPAVCAEILGVNGLTASSKAAEYVKLAEWFERHGRGLDRLGLWS